MKNGAIAKLHEDSIGKKNAKLVAKRDDHYAVAYAAALPQALPDTQM